MVLVEELKEYISLLRKALNAWPVLLLALAIWVYTRGYGFSNPYIKAYDPYYFYRVASGILTHGFWEPKDPLRYYPFGWDSRELAPGIPYAEVFFAKLSGSLLFTAKWLPFFFGLLAFFAFAFLSLLYGVGAIAPLVLSFIPSLLYRTSQGFADKEPVAFFLGLTSWYFFARFLEDKKVEDALLSGIALGLIATLWGGKILFLAPILLVLPFLLNEPEVLFKASLVPLLYVLLSATVPRYSRVLHNPIDLGLLTVFLLSTVYYFLTSKARVEKRKALGLIIAAAIILVPVTGLIFFKDPLKIPTTFMGYLTRSLISKTRITHANTVAENQPPRFSWKLRENTYWQELGFPFFFALFYAVIYLLYPTKLRDPKEIFLLGIVYTGLLAGSKGVRLLCFTAFGAALATAIWIKELLNHIDIAVNLLGFLMLFLAFWPIAKVTLQAVPAMGQSSMDSNWWTALKYLEFNTPPKAPIVTWWDYGYWIQTVANRTTLGDGGNVGPGYTLNWYTGHFFATDDYENATAWLKAWNLTYILIDRTMIPKYWAYSTLGGISNVMNVLAYRGRMLTDFGIADVYTGYSDDFGPIALAVVPYNNSLMFVLGKLAGGVPRWQYYPREVAYFSTRGIIACMPMGFCPLGGYANLQPVDQAVVVYEGSAAIIGDLKTMHSIFARLWFFNGLGTDFKLIYSNPEVKIFEYHPV